MKKSGIWRTCPYCKRRLQTNINRYRVECWPQHHEALELELSQADWEREMQLPSGYRAWEVRCVLSGSPVLEEDLKNV